VLDNPAIESFIRDGFVRLDAAFPGALADEARARLWSELPGEPDDPSSWTKPVVRLGYYAEPPFVAAANTPPLHQAFDQLAGVGNWLPCRSMGAFGVRFPSAEDPGDAGWHIDPSFGEDQPDFMKWRANLHSRGRALLMLFLFSDVGESDAPTRLRIGSHRIVARRLAPAGEAGLTLGELAAQDFAETAACPEVAAVGSAGTVYLCHPFLVHAAQPHRGTRPRFLAQPPLLPARPFTLDPAQRDLCAVERAILLALEDS
jgi:hypothetical protein